MTKIKENYRWKFLFTIATLTAVGLMFLYVSEFVDNVSKWKGVLQNIGIAFFFTGIAGIIQEYVLKNTLVNLIFSKLALKEDIERTGIVSVYPNLSDLNYRPLFKQAKKNIDIYHVYGQTWTNTYIEDIEDRLLNSNCKIRIILLAPDSTFIPGLAEIYNGKKPEELKQLIQEVSKLWKRIYLKKMQQKRKKRQSTIELYYHNGFPASSLYRIDDQIVYVQSKMTKGKSKKLSAYICRNTDKADLFDNYLEEMNDIIANEATKVEWDSIIL